MYYNMNLLNVLLTKKDNETQPILYPFPIEFTNFLIMQKDCTITHYLCIVIENKLKFIIYYDKI